MFKVNDVIVYSGCGVCRVNEISERTFGDVSSVYYVLKPVSGGGNTYYVPMDNETLISKMRKLISREEIEKLVSSMKDEDDIWIDNDELRKKEYRRIIQSGSCTELIRLIRTLYNYQKLRSEQKKKLRSAEENLLREAENILNEEFAFVLEIPKSDVPDYIRNHV